MAISCPPPGPTIYLCLDDFLRSLPPLASNPVPERKVFLAQFEDKIGSVPSQVLFNIANHVLKFGIPSAGSPNLLAKQQNTVAKPNFATGSAQGEKAAADSTHPRTTTPAPVAPSSRPQSTRPAPRPRTSTPHQRSDGAAEKTASASVSAQELDIWAIAAEWDLASAFDAMTVPQQAESNSTPGSTPEEPIIIEDDAPEASPIPDRLAMPAPVYRTPSVSNPTQAHPSQSALRRGSSLADLNANGSATPAPAKAPAARPVVGRHPSGTPAPQQFSFVNPQHPPIRFGEVTGPNPTAPSAPPAVPRKANSTAVARPAWATTIGRAGMAVVGTTAATPSPVGRTLSTPHLPQPGSVSAIPSGNSASRSFSNLGGSGAGAHGTPAYHDPTPPSRPATAITREGSSSSVSSKKRKATDAPEGGAKRKKNVFCPYCKKYFEKDLRKHITNNSKCNNDDKLAIYRGEGSLAPHASPNVHMRGAAASALKPALSQECMVLIPPTAGPGKEPLRDGQPAYVHMQYGAPHY